MRRRARGNQLHCGMPIEKRSVDSRVNESRDDFGVSFNFLEVGDKMQVMVCEFRLKELVAPKTPLRRNRSSSGVLLLDTIIWFGQLVETFPRAAGRGGSAVTFASNCSLASEIFPTPIPSRACMARLVPARRRCSGSFSKVCRPRMRTQSCGRAPIPERFVTARRTRFTQLSKISLAAGLPSSKSMCSTTVCVSGSQLADKRSLSRFGAKSSQVSLRVFLRDSRPPRLPKPCKVLFDLNRSDHLTN